MKKIICFLLLTLAFTTKAQTLIINGDDTFGDIAVEIVINGGTPIDIGNVHTGQSLSFTVPTGTIVETLEIRASAQGAYLFIEENDEYYQLYLDWLENTGTYFDNPENSIIYDAFMPHGVFYAGQSQNYFIGTLPILE
jgi:hypothetical protein